MSNREACQAYYNKVATSTDPRATGPYFYYSYKDFGFDVKKTLNELESSLYDDIHVIKDSDNFDFLYCFRIFKVCT